MPTVAPVNKIIPFSLVYGPGSRTSVFFQGCNIHCVYCHNPKTQQMCCNCQICVNGCPVKALSMRDGRVAWDKENAYPVIAALKSVRTTPPPASKTWMREKSFSLSGRTFRLSAA